MSEPILDPPRLMAISDGGVVAGLGEARWNRWLEALATARVDAVQVREKGLEDRRLLELALDARARLPPEVLLVINGRADVALAAGAGAVHLPSNGLPPEAVRARFPALRVGVSTHRIEEVEAAREAAAHWVTFGPVYPTPGKAELGPPAGLAGLRRAAAVGIPVLALGGVTHERLVEVAEAGAVGMAGIRAFADPAALASLVEHSRRAFPRREP